MAEGLNVLVGKLMIFWPCLYAELGDFRGFGSIEKFIVVVCIVAFAVYTRQYHDGRII